MKNLFAVTLCFWILAATALFLQHESDLKAQGQTTAFTQQDAYDFESLTVTSGAAVALTALKVNPTGQVSARAVQLTFETATVRYRYDGTSPTTAIGHEAAASSGLILSGTNNLNRLRFIASSSTGTVRVTYLR